MGEGPPAEPLVLHVIPSRAARGAQREARALADRLDSPGVRRHRLLVLVDGAVAEGDQVAADHAVDPPGGPRSTVGFDPRLVMALRRTIARLDPALVVAHGGEPLKYLVPALWGRRRRRPLAYYAIGTLGTPAHRPVRRTMWRYLIRRPRLVVAEGTEVLDECRDLLGVDGDRLVLVANGRDPEEFRPPGPAETGAEATPVLTFVGALTEQKRPDRFVALAAALRARQVPFRAVAVGDGPLAESLAVEASAAGVELTGARPDVAELLKATDVLVFPSLPRGEGMPGVLIEAGLSAVPVVATDVPGVRSIVVDGETGLVVDVDDFEALVEGAAALLVDPARRRNMGAAARRRCSERFSLDAVASEWRAALVPLLSSVP